jgi:hypothetical protein
VWKNTDVFGNSAQRVCAGELTGTKCLPAFPSGWSQLSSYRPLGGLNLYRASRADCSASEVELLSAFWPAFQGRERCSGFPRKILVAMGCSPLVQRAGEQFGFRRK